MTTTKYLEELAKEYALYTAQFRAIPRVYDGLKDSQRKALYLIRNRADQIKTMSLAGLMVSSNLYVHGDSSAAGAIGLMAAPYCNNIPLLEGRGTFGTKVAPQAISAPRYTYVKKPSYLEELMLVDSDVIPMKENYDGSTMEPLHFLPLIPLVLLNGVSGIASGWSTDILPHKIEDIIDATIKAIDGKKIGQLTPHYAHSDCDIKFIESTDDSTSWEFLGRVKKEDTNTVRITNLPPDMSLEKLREHLNKLEDDNKIQGYYDNTSDVFDIEVKFRRADLKKYNEEKLIQLFKLRSRKTERLVVIDFDNESIVQYKTIEDLIKEFVKHRFAFYVKRYEKKSADSTYESAYWKTLKECFDKKLPAFLPKAKNKNELADKVNEIGKKFGPDDKQVDKICSLPSYQWAMDNYQKVLDKIKEIEENLKYYNNLLKNQNKIWGVYKSELQDLKKLKFNIKR